MEFVGTATRGTVMHAAAASSVFGRHRILDDREFFHAIDHRRMPPSLMLTLFSADRRVAVDRISAGGVPATTDPGVDRRRPESRWCRSASANDSSRGRS